MQAKVPQNVQVADKIVGPLTLRHMIIIGAGGGLAYLIYVILGRSYYWEVWLPPVAIISTITLLVAFLKIYNLTFGKFFILLMEYIFVPRKRAWVKNSGEIFGKKHIIAKDTHEKEKKIQKGEKAQQTLKKIDDISQILDTYGKEAHKSALKKQK